MTKINSRQRRSNRFVRQCEGPPKCDHYGLCAVTEGRWAIANERRWRRTMRRMARGNFIVEECRAIPCPPFQDVTLQFFCEVR